MATSRPGVRAVPGIVAQLWHPGVGQVVLVQAGNAGPGPLFNRTMHNTIIGSLSISIDSYLAHGVDGEA